MPKQNEQDVYLLLWGWNTMTGEKEFGVREKNPGIPFTALTLNDDLAPHVFTGFKAALPWYTLPTSWNGTQQINCIQVNIEPFLARVVERGGVLLKFLSLEGIEIAAGLKEYQYLCRYGFNPELAGIANLIRFYGDQK